MKPSHLKKELQSYYKKEKNKLVFPNNMSLNQLAIEMWERLNYSEIDASVISRVIHGERLFSPKQLEVFCDVLDATDTQRHKLRNALWEDCYAKHGIDLNPSIDSYYIDLVEFTIKSIQRIRTGGHVEPASELTDILLSKLTNMFNGLNDSNYFYFARNIFPKLLQEKAWYYFETALSSKILNKILPIVNKMKSVAKIAKDKNTLGNALHIISDAYYVADRFDISCMHLKQSLTYLVNQERRLKAYRSMALNLAYLGDKPGVENIGKKIEKQMGEIRSIEPAAAIVILEGLGRAQGIVKIGEGLNTLRKAKEIYADQKKKKNNYIFQEIQLIRSNLEIIKHLSPGRKSEMQTTGEKGLLKALKYGYKRHGRKIEGFLSSTLN